MLPITKSFLLYTNRDNTSTIIVVLFCTILHIFAMPQLLFAQENFCDPGLKVKQNTPNWYRMRDDRCEGIFFQPLSMSSHQIELVSLTAHFEDFNTSNDSPLKVEWTPFDEAISSGESFHLRARSLKRRLYYRMDTIQPPAKKKWNWPINLLYVLRIHRENIGVVGWTTWRKVPNKLVYLPLRIRQQESQSRSREYEAVLLPKVEMKEIYVSLANVDQRGKSHSFIWDGKPLDKRYYPGGRRIDFSLPKDLKKGYYYLEIGVELEDGGVDQINFYIYLPG